MIFLPSRLILRAIWGVLLFVLIVIAESISYDNLYFTVESPDHLKYVYEISPSYSIGVRFPERVRTTYLYYADPPEACGALKNSLQVKGEGVLMERGECSFVEKGLNALSAGAAFALVTDSTNGSDAYINMVPDETGRFPRIPIAFLPGVSGRQFRQFFLYEGEVMTIKIPMNLTMRGLHQTLNKPPWELW